MIAHISEDGLNREESVAEHTQKTVFLCAQKGRRCGLAQVMSLCGIFHDMGKEKQKFSDYIRADENARRKQKGSIAHASTGAKYIYDRFHDSPGNGKIMAEMISYTVAAHHGLFDCVDIDHRDIFSNKIGEIEDYEEACGNAKRNYLNGYEYEQIFLKASEEFDAVWDKLKEVFANVKPLLLEKQGRKAGAMLMDCKWYLLACLQRLMLSILIDSDWEATSDFMENVDTLSKASVFHTQEIFAGARENFEAYMKRKGQNLVDSSLTEKEKMISNARNVLQAECKRFARYPAGIYCMTIPTGGGKTLSSLAYGLEFCRMHPETERIIYVSPYISITEQNAKVFRDAVGNARWVLEHHSSVLQTDGGENANYPDSEDYRAGKLSKYDMNWEEPFICTTFVQFMNTLFSDRKESVRRMHRLVNAVVIVDEVQSMPLKCVHTFNYMINFLNAVCNTNVILCTATQPTLEEAHCPICYSEPKYMVENAADWFRRFERVKIHTPELTQKYTFERLGDEIVKSCAKYRSILVVLNTKSAVRKLYDILKENKVPVEYLTTNLCAEHRSDRIETIKKKLEEKKEKIVVVSTNLIEAGVDISFECVYRSMAGLDSLAQTAGRCNRNGEMDSGRIHLVVLEGENIGSMEELQQNIRVAEHVIRQYNHSDKADSLLTPRWMEAYYRDIYSMAWDKMNFPIKKLDRNIMELLSRGFGLKEKKNGMNQAFKTAGTAYRVIDDNSFGVIVPYGRGVELIEAIQGAQNELEIRAYIRRAQRFTVNVRGSLLKQLDGLLMPVSDKFPDLYMVVPSAYHEDYGITAEWETLIF